MAPRVEDILVRLKLEGLEGLDRIRSSFRELGKVTQMSEKDILTARTRLLEFASTAGNTEAVISGLIPALKGLRFQVDICGAAYAELSNDIAQVNNVSRGYTDQATAQRNALNAQYGAITNNTEALRRQRAALLDLQQTTRTGSQLYTQLGADIQRTTARLDEMDAVVRRTNAMTGRVLPSSAAKIQRDLADVRERIRLERAALDELTILTDKQRKDFAQGDLAGVSGVRRAIAARQAALDRQLVSESMLSFSENVRAQREAIRTANAMYSSQKFISEERSPGRIGAYLGELPNTVAGLNQQLSELRDRLNNTTLGTRTYVDAALLMAATQRQLREATLGVAAGLVEQLRAGNITPSMANLREVLASVRGEQSLLNTNTAEGARAFQLAEMRARALERQLAALQTTQASLSRTPVSGFGAWSSGVRERVLQGARTERRLAQAQRETLQRTGSLTPEQQQLVDAANTANANYATAYRQHQRTLTDAQQQGFNDRLAAQQAAADAELRLQRQVNDAALADFQRRLNETAVLQQQRAMQRQLGFLGGQNLSSTYQQIVGLSSASAQVSEERMGRSATQVFNDTVASFQAGIAGAAAASVTAPSAVSASRNAGTNLAQSVIQQINRERPDMAAAGASFTDSFVQSVRNKVRAAAQAAQQLAVSTKPKAAATELTSGIVDGIGSATPAVASAAEKFADTFVNTVRRKAGAAADAARQMATSASTAVANTVLGGLPTAAMRVPRLSARTDLLMADPWQGPTGDYSAFISRVIASTERLRSPSLLPSRAESRDLWAGPIGDYNNFISRIISATERVRPQALLTYRAESLDPWSGIIGDYRKFIASIASATTELRSQAILTGTSVRGLLPPRAESRDLWAGPIGDYRNFVAAITTASVELRSQALLTGTSIRGLLTAMAQVRDPWIGAYNDYKNFINSITTASAELRGQALLTGTSIRGLLLPDITTVDPWSLPLSQYKRFIDSIVVATTQLRAQLLLSPAQMQPIRGLLAPTPVRALLPESAASLVPGRIDAQMSRLDQALARSRARSEAVLAEDALAGRMRRLLPMGQETVAAGMGASAGAGAAAANSSSAAWQRYTAELGKFGAVSKASIDQLNALKAVLDRQRASLSPLEADYAKVTRAIERQNAVIDRELARRDRSQRPRLSGMQLAQGFGAALTGGIFGGPEGLIGGLAGMGINGVGGAFAGAAIGAQVGMFRQQLSTITDYSARIDKMQIALRGVVKDQASYNAVLDAQAAITRDLNIPQENAIGGLTRLSAAVLGAGGTVTDSTFAYRAMTEAIKATGGSAEQVDGALLALTQVFSKGKVSAEELNQIAERLPGTFTLFAKAAGKTGPELQKALQQGQVGITDLTKFLQLLSKQYGAAALGVSRSTQEAGARLTVTVQALQRDVGRALQPAGAAFQTAFAGFITDIGPSLVATLKSIAPALQSMASLVPYMGELAKALLSLGAVVGLTAAFVKLGGAMVFLAGAIKSVGGIAAFATLQLQGLSGAITGATLINPWTAAAAGVAALTVAISKAVLEQKALTDETARYVEAASKQRAPEVATTINKLEDQLRAARKAAQAYGPANRSATTFTEPLVQGLIDLVSGATTARNKVEELETRLRKLQGVYRARIELDAVFSGQRGIPQGFKVISGRLAYFVPGKGYVDAETGLTAAETLARGGQQPQQQAETKRAETLLDAIDKREEAIGQARIQLEEQAREIRKQAIEQAKQLEEQFASQRLNRERDIAGLRRQAAGLEQDIAFSLEALRVSAAGGDPELIRIQQNAAQVARDINEERIRTEERIFDEQTSRAKAIKDLQLATAKAVNEGNARYAKAIGDAQLQYARTVAKLQDEASGRQASRLVVAQQLASMYQQRDHLQTMRVQAGEPLFDNPAQYRGNEPLYNTSTGVRSALPYNIEREIPPSFVSTDRRITVLIGQLNSLSRVSQTVAAPAIDRIAVNTDDLTASLNKATAALAELDAKFKELQATVGASQLQKAAIEQAQALLQPLQTILQQRQQLVTDRQREEAIRKLRLGGKTEEQARQSLEALDASARLGTQMSGLRTSFIGKATTEDERAKLTALFDELDRIAKTTLESITKATTDLVPKTLGAELADAFLEVRDQLDALVAPINMIKSAADSIGSAFGNAFKGIISGSVTAKEALATFLQSVADNFLDMAAQIITQWIKMAILNSILNLFPESNALKPSSAIPALPAPKLNAMGNAYAKNGIVPFAYGGVVDRPMLFPFAKGGAMQTGVLGEAGPEAIIPLKRGRDGRLGVSGGGSTTNVTVNVDATNTSASSNTTQGQALGRVISQAVQGELVRQQRPGGLLDPNRTR